MTSTGEQRNPKGKRGRRQIPGWKVGEDFKSSRRVRNLIFEGLRIAGHIKRGDKQKDSPPTPQKIRGRS